MSSPHLQSLLFHAFLWNKQLPGSLFARPPLHSTTIGIHLTLAVGGMHPGQDLQRERDFQDTITLAPDDSRWPMHETYPCQIVLESHGPESVRLSSGR